MGITCINRSRNSYKTSTSFYKFSDKNLTLTARTGTVKTYHRMKIPQLTCAPVLPRTPSLRSHCRAFREVKFCDNFGISGRSFGPNFAFSYTLYTFFTSPSAQDRENSTSLESLFLTNCPLRWPLSLKSFFLCKKSKPQQCVIYVYFFIKSVVKWSANSVEFEFFMGMAFQMGQILWDFISQCEFWYACRIYP